MLFLALLLATARAQTACTVADVNGGSWDVTTIGGGSSPYTVADTVAMTFTADNGFTCTDDGAQNCANGVYTAPACLQDCTLGTVANGAWDDGSGNVVPDNTVVTSGTTTAFAAAADFTCTASALCTDGNLEAVTCEAHCVLAAVADGAWDDGTGTTIADDTKVASGSTTALTPANGYSCTAATADCADGNLDTITCSANPCSVADVLGGSWDDTTTNSGVDASPYTVASGTQMTFTAASDYTCTDDGAQTCTAEDYNAPVCLQGCTLAAVANGAWDDGSGTPIADGTAVTSGTTTAFVAAADYTCTASALCTNGVLEAVTCEAHCVLAGETNGAWDDGAGTPIADDTKVASGTTTAFVAAADFTCTASAACNDGVLDAITCEADCVLAGETNGAWDDGAGTTIADDTKVASGSTTAIAAASGYTCSPTDAVCTDGTLAVVSCSTTPVVLADCTLAAVSGGTWDDGDDTTVVSGTTSAITAATGNTCTPATAACSDGTLDSVTCEATAETEPEGEGETEPESSAAAFSTLAAFAVTLYSLL